LEKGGNAFDAAAAAGLTLQVVEPHLNGPLGEAPILVWSEKNQRCDMICGQGVAPAGATIAHYRQLGLDLCPAPASRRDRARRVRRLDAAAARLRHAAARRHPRPGDFLRRERLPAGLAHPGDDRRGRRDVPHGLADIGGGLSAERRAAEGRAAVPQSGLAATYKRVLAEAEAAAATASASIDRARDAWYRGFVAEAIDRFCRTEKVLDSSGGGTTAC
jgi:gamma-glutamyltranspeptidase/glutathione hydrolase